MAALHPTEVQLRLHGAVLDAAGPWRRSPQRPEAERQVDFDERFDAFTLFYDAFRVGDDVEMIGPPLLNLAEGLRPLELRARGRRYARRMRSVAKDRLHRHRITDVPRDVTSLHLSCRLGRFELPIGNDLSNAFRERRVLVTQSKDNPLSWIAEWIDHHVATQGIDAVILYDNGSTAYDAEAVRVVLRARPGLAVFSVVEWPYPFGPTGGPGALWDSDYGQHGTWEHAWRRLCRTAATITFGDIDELVVAIGPNVTDRALAARTGVCSYRRRAVLALPERRRRRAGSPRHFADYSWYEPGAGLLSPKYTVAPASLEPEHQLMVHRVDGIEADDEADVLARHFDAMRIEWRDGADAPVRELRPTEVSPDAAVDEELRQQFAPQSTR